MKLFIAHNKNTILSVSNDMRKLRTSLGNRTFFDVSEPVHVSIWQMDEGGWVWAEAGIFLDNGEYKYCARSTKW